MRSVVAGYRSLTPIRQGAIGAGVVLLSFGVLADRFGLGSSGSLGIGQVLLGAAGLFFILLGLLGRRYAGFHQGLAIVAVNVLILFGCLELGAIIFARLAYKSSEFSIEHLSYYRAQDWTSRYWREARSAEVYRYEPYVLWRHQSFSGQTVNYDQSGHRPTPGSQCGDGSLRVYTFGGSTMLGWGAPDWGTIPAHLQRELDERFGDAVCVVNLAEDGFVSTQSVIALALELQSGNVPDVVVFYDGVNDVLAAYESGRPGTHVTLDKIASRFEEREHLLWRWYKSSRQYALLEKWLIAPLRTNRTERAAIESELPQEVAATYLSNYRLVQALAESYGFQFYLFLQPHLGVGQKPLTTSERQMMDRFDSAWLAIARETYLAIESFCGTTDHLKTLSDVFDDQREQIWIDEAGHVTPEGNKLLANAMMPDISSAIALVQSRKSAEMRSDR